MKECNLAFHYSSHRYQGPELRRPADLCRLARSYEAARELFPIATPFEAGDAGVVNVAVHVRAGPGSKSVPESAYVAALEATARALEGWRRLSPTRSRPPLPQAAVFGVAGALLDAGFAEMGLLTIILFET